MPHDDENAAFGAALASVRTWGGVVVVVDTAARDTGYSARFNQDAPTGRAIDPNRAFTDDAPVYTGTLLRDVAPGQRPIMALHTNAAGADPALVRCPGEVNGGGSGAISVALCTDRVTARRSTTRRWPFDDDDTLALVSHPANARDPTRGDCSGAIARDDFNMLYETVPDSDGPLSTFAAAHGLDYVNFETRDRGNNPSGIADARDRLVAMVDRVMERCAPIPGLALHPFPTTSVPLPGRRPVAKGRTRPNGR